MVDYIARVQATVMFDSRSMDADRFYGSQLRNLFNHISANSTGGLTFQVLDRYVDEEAYEVVQFEKGFAGYFRIVPVGNSDHGNSPMFRLNGWYTGVRIFLQPTLPEVDMARVSLGAEIQHMRRFADAFRTMLIAWSRNSWKQPAPVEVSG